ncbi:MAG: hydrogenase maturation nickel metallochaperone HypA [Verrucomicrobia bacterium]|jgi:hydrogenase nickel incorporation protein HypA/HybF|nr:hydrogenase maturation nickel metallochaperone HypA [Verrucomicrobiota bacterium]
MHEFGLMQEVVRMAVEKAEEAGATRIHCIRLRIGRISGVVPEAMRFAHEVLIEDTLAAGSTLEIEEGPVRCWCAQCKATFKPEKTVFRCPVCGTISSDVRDGREMQIVNMEIS